MDNAQKKAQEEREAQAEQHYVVAQRTLKSSSFLQLNMSNLQIEQMIVQRWSDVHVILREMRKRAQQEKKDMTTQFLANEEMDSGGLARQQKERLIQKNRKAELRRQTMRQDSQMQSIKSFDSDSEEGLGERS